MHPGDCGLSAGMAAAAESTPELSLSSAHSNLIPLLDLFMPTSSSQQAFLPQTLGSTNPHFYFQVCQMPSICAVNELAPLHAAIQFCSRLACKTC